MFLARPLSTGFESDLAKQGDANDYKLFIILGDPRPPGQGQAERSPNIANELMLKSPTMSRPTPHRTPLRRLSQGSLFALSRSQSYPDAPHGLGFLEPALSELVDETEALQANVDGLGKLGESLRVFNESFASWLYVMNMNALTTDWPQVCTYYDSCFQSIKFASRLLQTRRLYYHGEEQVCQTFSYL